MSEAKLGRVKLEVVIEVSTVVFRLLLDWPVRLASGARGTGSQAEFTITKRSGPLHNFFDHKFFNAEPDAIGKTLPLAVTQSNKRGGFPAHSDRIYGALIRELTLAPWLLWNSRPFVTNGLQHPAHPDR